MKSAQQTLRKEIQLFQLKELLDIYHGKKTVDLQSQVEVDMTRKKGFYRHYFPFIKSSPIVKDIESLVKKMQTAGLKENDFITGSFENELANILCEGAKLKPCATQLLCKRISTIMHSNMQSHANYNKDKINLTYAILAVMGFIRLCSEFFPKSTFLLSISLHLLATKWRLEFRTKYVNEMLVTGQTNKSSLIRASLKKIDDDHFLQKKCLDFSKQLKLHKPPTLLVASGLDTDNAFAVASPNQNLIVIGGRLAEKLDKEELVACLAHEIGHIYDFESSIQSKKYLVEEATLGIPMLAVFGFKMMSTLLHCISDNDFYYYSVSLIDWILMLSTITVLLNYVDIRAENFADDIATKLAGPLSHSSGIRTLSANRHHYHIPRHTIWSKFSEALACFGLEDIFSTHPEDEKRMRV